ncbi:MAG: hypothetical protein B7C24_05695 [Bacteroidetes bacterium 4572_77]|nr:MAG: hypothetical protein B7C24_05695 [Bacteroidetes bacterium 4572_77]
MNKYFTFLLLLVSTGIFAQSIGVGQWRDELPYRETIAVAVTDDIVYGATPYSLFTFRKEDNSMKRYSKINGLSDLGVSTIAYSDSEDVLFVAYSNTNIDLIRDGQIINISDIKRKQILGKKTINNIYFIDEIAYLSCGFGIVLIDIKKEEVKDTWYIGDEGNSMEVFDIVHEGNTIYAATENGIRIADLEDDNLANFQSWTKLEDVPHADGAFTNIEKQNEAIAVSYSPSDYKDIIYVLENSEWTVLEKPNTKRVLNLCNGKEGFYVIYSWSIGKYEVDLTYIEKVYTYGGELSNIAPSQIIEEGTRKWIADRNYGLVNTSSFWESTSYKLNGPRTANAFDLAGSENRLVVAPGGRNDSYGNLYNKDGIFTKNGDYWTNYYGAIAPEIDTIYDYVSVAINPNNVNQYALGSWGKGITVMNNEGVEATYGIGNSSLTPVAGFSSTIRVGGVVYDKNGNLWANSASSNALMHRMTPSGEWTAWELGSSSARDVGKMIIDSRSYKWMELREGSSDLIFVFDETQAVGNQLKSIKGSPGQGNIPGSVVSAIAEDLDGEIWIGSNEGIGVIYNPTNIFEGGNYDAQRIVVEKDGYAQYLLAAETVTAIAIDGANQKWVGTSRAGVFLLSPDGIDELEHFTTENSPLYSDNITAIQVMKNGEVFIATNKGIISYKGKASEPDPEMNEVYAYPNPVRPEYSGSIAITGLVRDANVKITDVYGGLVYESQAFGGQAIWDGRGLDKQKVNTGVYMVFVSDEQGEKTLVTKILFVK